MYVYIKISSCFFLIPLHKTVGLQVAYARSAVFTIPEGMHTALTPICDKWQAFIQYLYSELMHEHIYILLFHENI
jgi:hypothetical protein